MLNRMGMRHKYAGRFTAAERAYRGAMALALTRRTPDAAVLADLYHNLGGLEHHPAVAADRAALAPILDALGHSEAAGLLLRQALQVLAPDHKDVAPALNNRAAIRHRAGAPREAKQLYRRALALKQHQYGARHRELGDLWRERTRSLEYKVEVR